MLRMMMHGSVLSPLAAAGLATLALGACNQNKSQAPSSTQTGATTTKASYPDWPGGAMPAVPQRTVDPRAIDALKNMSRYLMSLKSFTIETNGSTDAVTQDGKRIQLDG